VERGGREGRKGDERKIVRLSSVCHPICLCTQCFPDLITSFLPFLPPSPHTGIDFKFDNAGFDLGFLPFRVPYPVPFRLLNDEVKGWLEVTYLSPRLRLSRGNKGTIFVLQKVEEE
jgi:hypothetical protein